MSQLLTTDFKIRQANFFLTNIASESVFLFGGSTLPFADANSELVENTIQDKFYEPHTNMVFGKYVGSEDYSIMIPYIPWVSGTVYTQYDHEEVLLDTNFYVVTLEAAQYSVFKCLFNNNGVASTDKPILSETSPADELYQTSDGYIWKLMYTFSDVLYDKFATADYVPFVANAAVTSAAVSGSIDIVEIVEGGRGYINNGEGVITSVNVGGNARKFYVESTANTALSANTGFYSNSAIYVTSGPGAGQLRKIVDYGFESSEKYIIVDTAFDTSLTTSSFFDISPNLTLDGDGSGFQGRLIIDTVDNSVESIQVVNRGSNYTYATPQIGANTTAINTATYSEATLRTIIPPYGGHGFDQQQELFGKYVCISESFVGNEVPTANNDYRTIGLMQNPEFISAALDLTSVVGLANGSIITQTSTGATGTVTSIDVANTEVTLDTVSGVFDTTNVVSGNTTYTVSSVLDNNDVFDQRLTLTTTLTSGSGFVQDELVIQETTEAQGYVHQVSGGTIYLVQTEGTFTISLTDEIVGQTSDTRSLINTITNPAAVKYSGEILYVENFDSVTRSDSQTETIKLIIGF